MHLPETHARIEHPVGFAVEMQVSAEQPQSPEEDPHVLRGADGVAPSGEGRVTEEESDVEGCA